MDQARGPLRSFPGLQGWTVEASQRISSGSFVAEYLGEYVTTPEARRRLRQYDLWNKQQRQQALKVPRGFRPQPCDQLVRAAPYKLVPGHPIGEGLGLGADPGSDPGTDLVADPGADPGSEDLESRSVLVPRGWSGHALMVSFSRPQGTHWADSLG